MHRELSSTPFVLIDDASAGSSKPARLFRDPVETIIAVRREEVRPALEALKQARARGLHVAGYMGYEAGYALEERLSSLEERVDADKTPLLWFGVFAAYEEVAAGEVAAFLGQASASQQPASPLISREDYADGFAAIKDWIVAGDIYQANYTFPNAVDVGSDPVAHYAALRPRALAGYGALVFTGDHWLLSFSPEQFFSLEGDTLHTRPMKGTALRDADPVQDAANARALKEDPKQRAENLMIVDLLRNDLSRISVPGSVKVPELFTIESYPTVHQMTSSVIAQLRPGLDAVDALMALFPCGSITGAPKIRAMEIIHTIERDARGPYTGAIGTVDAQGNAAFNVAIRTICVKDGDSKGAIGLGSGLVADSNMMSEWNECLDKGRFLSAGSKRRDGNDG